MCHKSLDPGISTQTTGILQYSFHFLRPQVSRWLLALQKTSQPDLCWHAGNPAASSAARHPEEITHRRVRSCHIFLYSLSGRVQIRFAPVPWHRRHLHQWQSTGALVASPAATRPPIG